MGASYNLLSEEFMDKQIIHDLLSKIYLECQEQLAGVDAKRFRAQNRNHIDTLDLMEKVPYLEHVGDVYVVRLGALPFIQDTVPQVATMIDHGNEIYKILESAYIDNLDQEISVDTISKMTETSIKDTVATFLYIKQTYILGGYSNDLAKEGAFARPSEFVIKYKSFSEIIEKEHAKLVEYNERLESEEKIEWKYDEPIQHFEQLLHSRIVEKALQQYYDGHLHNAVFSSVTVVFDLIRERTGVDEDGDKLIGAAFSPKDPYLALSDLETKSKQNDQIGFIQILKGVYQGVRSPKAHSLVNDLTYLKAAQYLVLASLLARRIEEAELVKKDSNSYS